MRRCSITELLTRLWSQGIEVFVRDGEVEHRLMDAWSIFNRTPITDPRRRAELRGTRAFLEMLERKDEIFRHWNSSPGAAIVDYPDDLRIFSYESQDLDIEEQRAMGWTIVDPHTGMERWLSLPRLMLGESAYAQDHRRDQRQVPETKPARPQPRTSRSSQPQEMELTSSCVIVSGNVSFEAPAAR
jgi:hypothetical protein